MSIARYEHYLCSRLALRRGSTVLQIGSGTGDIALELVRYADVDVVGIESNMNKVLKVFECCFRRCILTLRPDQVCYK